MADSQDHTSPLTEALRALLAWLRRDDVDMVIIGGVAATLLGRPRTTADIDALVLMDEENWALLIQAAIEQDIVPRITDPLEFALQNRVLLMKHEPTDTALDVTFGLLPFERDLVERAQDFDLAGMSVPVPMPEDLLVLKAVAHRARDLADIEGILEANENLDLSRTLDLIRQFAATLETPELLSDFEAIVERCRRG